jgi:acyl-homoserine lactone acylase PvdQ
VRTRSRIVISLLTCVALVATADAAAGNGPAAATPLAQRGAPAPTYRAHDYAHGQAMSILPPGENGLVTAAQLAQYEATGQRPPNSQDQLGKYAGLLYGYRHLTDASLPKYYDDESFGVRTADITRVEHPETGVTIYRDTHDVPHIYGNSDATMAFGAGYAQAEDRLFLMDVLRHYGEGTLAHFLGSSCQFERMDHDQLLLAPYTQKQAVAQVNALPREYGKRGQLAKSLIYHYVAGVNAYIQQAKTDPNKMPADYVAATPDTAPQPWTVADVVAIAGLIGGIFGKGGGAEIQNAHLLQYLRRHLGTKAGNRAFRQFRTSNDPLAATTVVDRSFPYERHGKVNPRTVAMPDYGKPITGGPVDTAPNCNPTPPTPASTAATAIIRGLQHFPAHMSNALVVNASHSTGGHPIAVFGPQVAYYAPQILAEEDLHAPNYDAEGASFPGTGIVELGRGEDFAWSATSAGSDLVDMRLEKVCKPGGGKPAKHGLHYLFRGHCLAMRTEHFQEVAYPKPGGQGTPTVLNHVIHLTRHGIVQGWTTSHGKPVAVVQQRSTYHHEVDSLIGFMGWGDPALTYNVRSWMRNAARINYTFNWFYVDNRDTGYFVSGWDPVRPSDVNPDLPTWGTGNAEWRGILPANRHVHEINPKQGFFISWNNKPAPGFAAADDQYGYGQVYRSVLLVRQLKHQLAVHHGKLTRADVVQAMETAASQDLDGVTVLPLLLRYLHRHGAGGPRVAAMLRQLRPWVKSGAHRIRAHPADSQYAHAAAIAISDELIPRLIRAIFDPILRAGGLGSQGSNGGASALAYRKLPMQFVNTPNSGGAHLGSAYDGGYESYLVTDLEQLLGRHPRDSFGREITSRECSGGLGTCAATIKRALRRTYRALARVNGTSDVAKWTASTASAAAKQAMPVYDQIQFSTVGVIGQPPIPWQNRPTFQQVIEFPAHRPRR